MRGARVVSTACESGLLEDDELDELEPVGCARSTGASARLAVSNATAADACRETFKIDRRVFHIGREAIGRFRDGEERFRSDTRWIRRSH